jgi:queuine/archaeosine tRNA-ribosyltransferase
MMAAMRQAIAEGRFEAWRADVRSRWLTKGADQSA